MIPHLVILRLRMIRGETVHVRKKVNGSYNPPIQNITPTPFYLIDEADIELPIKYLWGFNIFF